MAASDDTHSSALVFGNVDKDRGAMDIEAQQMLPGGSLLKLASDEVRRGFVRKVYGLLSVQLPLTIVIAAPFQFMSQAQLNSQKWLLSLSVVMTLVVVCAMTCCKDTTRSYPYNYAILFAFTFFEAILIGYVSAAYTWQSVMMCAGLTTIIFCGLTVYAFKTNTDFTGFGPMLYGALLSLVAWGISICFLGAMGVPIDWAIMFYDLVGVLVFVIYIVYDTQLIIGGEHKSHKFTVDDYVFAALTLYLDIMHLFLRLLRLLGKKK
jgi:FtsH-binding integral membrane protein